MKTKLIRFILNNKHLLLILLLAMTLRFPWLYTSIERDEGDFGYVAWRWLEGDIPYRDTIDNKPPLIYLLYAMPMYFFGNDIIPIRIFANILFFISIIFLYKLVKQWYGKKISLLSCLFYAIFMNVPTFESHLVMTESFMVPFVIFSIYFFSKYINQNKKYLLVLSSFMMCLAFLTRQAAIVGFLLLFFMICYIYKKNKKKLVANLLVFSISFFIPIFISLSYFWRKNALFYLFEKLIKGIILYYVHSPQSNYIPLQHAFLIVTGGAILWIFTIIGLFKLVKNRRVQDIFLITWFFLFLAVTIIPPSFGHYYLQIVAPCSIIAAIGFNLTFKKVRKSKKRFIAFILTISFLSLFSLNYQLRYYPDYNIELKNFGWQASDAGSYTKQMKLTDFIHENAANESIFIWGYAPQIYWLSEHQPPKRYWLNERIKRQNLRALCPKEYPSAGSWIKTSQKQFERHITNNRTDINLFIFLRNRNCKGFEKPIFSDLLINYTKIELNGIQIYKKNK